MIKRRTEASFSMLGGGMGSMMRHGWLDTDLIAILLVAALIAALRLLLPAGAHGGNGRMPKAALLVLVVIGALAVAVVLLSGPTQWTMVPTMMGG